MIPKHAVIFFKYFCLINHQGRKSFYRIYYFYCNTFNIKTNFLYAVVLRRKHIWCLFVGQIIAFSLRISFDFSNLMYSSLKKLVSFYNKSNNNNLGSDNIFNALRQKRLEKVFCNLTQTLCRLCFVCSVERHQMLKLPHHIE